MSIDTVALNSKTTQEALKQSGLDFDVIQLPIIAQDQHNQLDIDLPMVANCRILNSKTHVLGVVGKDYSLLQNRDAFKVFDPFFENGLATIESAGCLYSGKKTFIQAKINDIQTDVVKNDTLLLYLLLANSHDGSLAVYYGFTPPSGILPQHSCYGHF